MYSQSLIIDKLFFQSGVPKEEMEKISKLLKDTELNPEDKKKVKLSTSFKINRNQFIYSIIKLLTIFRWAFQSMVIRWDMQLVKEKPTKNQREKILSKNWSKELVDPLF